MVSFNVTYGQAGHIFKEADEYQLRGCSGVRWDGSTIIAIPNGNDSTPYLHLDRCVEINIRSAGSPQWIRAIRIYRSLYPGMNLADARNEMINLLEKYGHIRFKLTLE